MVGRWSFPFGARPIFKGELLVSGSPTCLFQTALLKIIVHDIPFSKYKLKYRVTTDGILVLWVFVFLECSYSPSPIWFWCDSFGPSMLMFWHCSPHLWQNKSLRVLWNIRDFRCNTPKNLVVALFWFVKKHKGWRQQQHLLGKIVPLRYPFFDCLYLVFT